MHCVDFCVASSSAAPFVLVDCGNMMLLLIIVLLVAYVYVGLVMSCYVSVVVIVILCSVFCCASLAHGCQSYNIILVHISVYCIIV